MERFPVHRDFAAADAEEAAEIDDRGTRLAGAVDQHVDDAPHVLIGSAADLAANDGLDFLGAKDGDRRLARGLGALLWLRDGGLEGGSQHDQRDPCGSATHDVLLSVNPDARVRFPR